MNLYFCLSGCGHLERIMSNGNRLTVRIRIIQESSSKNSSSEELWLDCLVTEESLVSKLNRMNDYLKKEQKIIVSFTAQYKRFAYAHHTQTLDDAEILIGLQAQLLDLDGYRLVAKL